jgi:hypothetical protein
MTRPPVEPVGWPAPVVGTREDDRLDFADLLPYIRPTPAGPEAADRFGARV